VTMKSTSRQVDGVTIVDLSGSITLDEGSAVLRKTVKGLSQQGSSKIVLNLGGVTSVDSTGIGELVSAYTSVRNAGGELKLLNLTREVHDLLRITKLCTVFDIEDDETSAIAAFQH
jgi:anti-sigma B factor antagonist